MGFVDGRGERALYVDPGVNNSLTIDEIDMEYASRTKFIHFTSFVGDKPLQAQKRLLKKLSENVKVSFDPGSLYARLGLTGFKEMIAETYVFMPNQGELVQLTGKPDYRAGSQFMLDKGVSVVAVKLGSRGCYVTDRRHSHLVEPFKVDVVDTTGAGDAFCAGFLYGLMKNKSLYDCGRIGNYVASRCITVMGARTGLPKLRDLEECKLT
jgi:ribokinase